MNSIATESTDPWLRFALDAERMNAPAYAALARAVACDEEVRALTVNARAHQPHPNLPFGGSPGAARAAGESARHRRRAAHPEIRKGDALALLPDALTDLPTEGTVCVDHTIVTYQFSAEEREALDDTMAVAGLRRPVRSLALEGRADLTYHLTPTRHAGGVKEVRELALCHPHGAWVEWLAGSQNRGLSAHRRGGTSRSCGRAPLCPRPPFAIVRPA